MKKVLIIHVLGIEYEGMTSVIYNYCTAMNKEGLKFDILSPNHVPDELREKFASIGEIIEVPNRKKKLPEYCKSLSVLLRAKKYDVIHIHGNSGTMMIEACLARINLIPQIIVHCHNTTCSHPFLNRFMTPIMISMADDLLCCSNAAGKWLYGHSEFFVLNNAIDTERFRYNEKCRKKTREELEIKSEFVLGHVGHFTEQKNHMFLLELYSEIVKEQSNTKLILVGDGSESEKIHEKVRLLGLEKEVIFVGKIKEPESMYFAMDLFLFPSKWEGLGLALIEAQASGLHCIASNNVSKESNITGNINYIDYRKLEEWKRYIVKYINSYNSERLTMSDKNIEKIRKRGYDITIESEELRRLYLYKDIKNEFT